MLTKAKEEGHCLPVTQILVILRDVLMAILHLHSHNPPIAHRDIQTKNILCGTDGNYKLTHFGNASTIHGTPKGTISRTIATEDIRQNSRLAYRAPEQVDLHKACVLNEKVDVWAIGILLFTLFYFATPFEGSTDGATSSSILKGFNTGKAAKASKGRLVTRGAMEIMSYCMTLNPLKRPSCGMVIKRCESLHANQILPYWPGISGGNNQPPPHQLSKAPLKEKSPKWSPIQSPMQSPPKQKSPTWTSSSNKRSMRKESLSVSSSPMGGIPNTPGSSFAHNVGETKKWEGVLSKWYKLVGGQHRKRLWVLKATSRCLCGPKPKYVRLIVVALWENTLTLGGFFQLLRYRPLAESPIIAIKALTTILKVLRQGPPQCLTECSTYVDVIDEVGQMWTTTLGNGHRPYGYEDEKLDEPLVLLIVKLSSMLVQKVRFHQHHPEYAELFTTIPPRDAKGHTPGVEEEGLERVTGVVGRLLSLQEHTLATIDTAMLVVNGNPATGVVSEGALPTLSMLFPLAEESYVTWVATARLMSIMAKLSNMMTASCMDRYSALKLQYVDQVHDVKRLLRCLGKIPEVRALQDTLTPGGYSMEEGIVIFVEDDDIVPFESSSWVHPAQSKAEVMVALQREEELVEQLSASKSAVNESSVKQEDIDDVSDNDEEYQEFQHDCTSSWPKLVPLSRMELDSASNSTPFIPPQKGRGDDAAFQIGGPGVSSSTDRHWTSAMKNGSGIGGPAAVVSSSSMNNKTYASAVSQQQQQENNNMGDESLKNSSKGIAAAAATTTNRLTISKDNEFSISNGSAALMPPLPTRTSSSGVISSCVINPQLRVDNTFEEKAAALERKAETPPVHPFQHFQTIQRAISGSTSLPLHAPPKLYLSPPKDMSIVYSDKMAAHECQSAVVDGLQNIRENGEIDQVLLPPPHEQKGGVGAVKLLNQQQQQQCGRVRPKSALFDQPQPELLSSDPEKKRIALAMYDYEAQGAEQLSFNVNDVIILHCDKMNGKGWGLGEINGKMGWFPGDYVSFLNDSVSVDGVGQITSLENGEVVRNVESQSYLDPDLLPEHKFSIQMARAEPWKDSLSVGGQRAYAELVKFFRSTQKVIHFDSLKLKAVLGSGAFAIVFHAVYLKRSVAVKKLVGGGGGPMERNLRDFQTEAALLSQLRHPNIISPVGATIEPVTFVMEYCSRGNLMNLLMDSSISLEWKLKKRLLEDVASGMQYLHQQDPVIIHRDLKSLNILIDENWVAKVSDFGLSRFKAPTVSEKMTGQAGTYHWMAPEVINSQHYSEKADIYSFGVIMWEVSFRAIPYDGMQPVQIVAAVLGRRERPRIPPGAPKRLSVLMQECWQHSPSLRPSFDEIMDRLAKLRFSCTTSNGTAAAQFLP